MGKALKVAIVCLFVLGTACSGPFNRKAPYTPREYKYPSQYVNVNGLTMCYIETGKGEKTILFIHGLGGSISNWEYNIDAFAAKYHVIAIDLPGHGNSDKPELPYSVKLDADYVYRFMKEKNIEKAVLVGHSMGGQIATLVSLAHPEMVEKLVLAAPSGADVYLPSTMKWFGERQYIRRAAMVAVGVSPASYPRFEMMMWRYLERDGKHNYATALVYDAHSHPTEEFLKAELKYDYDFIVSPEFPKFAEAYTKSAASIPVDFIRDELQNVKVPALIVWGRSDGIVPFENAVLFNDGIPVSMMALFPDCGHLSMVEQPDRFNRVVMEFVD